MRNMEKNLKIRMRLLIVFLITILIALALTFLSIRQTIKIQKDYTSILTGPIAITYAVQSSETEVNSIARQLRDMALSGYDTSIMDEIQASVDSIEKSDLHDSVKEIVTFGDADNGYDMILNAGVGVVMANGSDKTKSVADYITDDNDYDGIGNYIEKFILGEQKWVKLFLLMLMEHY